MPIFFLNVYSTWIAQQQNNKQIVKELELLLTKY